MHYCIVQKMAYFHLWGPLFLFWSVISESRENPAQIVSASQGEDVTLPCFKSTMLAPESCYRVKWTKLFLDPSRQPILILARPQMPPFRDAEGVSWGTDKNGDMSLSLKSLNKSNEGEYCCEIWEGWKIILVKNLQLKVKDCKTLDAVKAAPGTLAHLHCPVDTMLEPHRRQNVSWVKLKAGVENPMLLNSKTVESNGTLLAIHVRDYSDGGWFRCKYGQTQRCFDLHLQVQAMTTNQRMEEPKNTGSRTFSVTLVSSLTGFAVICSVIGLIIYHRCYVRRLVQNTQRNPGGFLQCNDGLYEDVQIPGVEEQTNLQINSLYMLSQDGGMDTFQCR
ncbi:CXADR-like membrane protein isoform X2 [Genypterus blacodes]|uniref:CXADR-like membrane protein isoform X2 n=1 Tax=Genypterus blacodes TaxID=154954 RepID=UPI003F76B506